METDYIRRDAAKVKVWKCPETMLPTQEAEDYLIEQIDSIPAAAVRPVVLCRDCENAKHWYSDKFLCYLWSESGIDVFADGFCSYGKRRGADMGGTP